MASHRKPKQRPFTGGSSRSARTAATIALAGAATAATAFESTGHAAEPRPTPAQVKSKVAEYHQQAEQAAERYNGARERAEAARSSYEELRDEAARKTSRLNTARNALGSYATAQYRSGAVAPSLRLAMDSSPERYLAAAGAADHAADRQASAVARIVRQIRGLAQVRTEAGGRLEELNRSRGALARHKRTVEAKLAAADRLLDRLTAEQRHRASADGGTGGEGHAGSDKSGGANGGKQADGGRQADGSGGSAEAVGRRAGGSSGAPHTSRSRASSESPDAGLSLPLTPAPSSRAALAVSYAYEAIGKPYVWGATGPTGYDCSGLTQAAWRAAGVALPRTTYTQIGAGKRITRSQLAPGDLVFFYSGVSHVGLYIGGGRMIHAPHPGAPVRIAPIDHMPFAGAVRPA